MIAEAPVATQSLLQLNRVAGTLQVLLAARRLHRNENSQQVAVYHEGESPRGQSNAQHDAD